MSEATTVVGPQTHVVGSLRGDEDLTVVGRIDGSVSLSQSLTVEANGIVVADVEVERALISGTVVGNVTASDLIQIEPEGRVVGDLSAARVVLADGASFRGNIAMAGVSGDAVAQASEQRGAVSSTASASRRATARKPAARGRAQAASKSSSAPRPKTAAGRKVRARRR